MNQSDPKEGSVLGGCILTMAPVIIGMVIFAIWLCSKFFIFGFGGASEEYKRNHPSAFTIHFSLPNFSPEGRKIIFHYQTLAWAKMATYDLATGEVFKYDKIGISRCLFPAYSRDGTQIVFLGASENGGVRNIYLINPDGDGLRKLTNYSEKIYRKGEVTVQDIVEGESGPQNFIIAPSFSPDGKHILYAKSTRARKRAPPLSGVMNADWDIYELEIATGKERRLTDYNFYDISWPYYLADGKRFIFAGEGPVKPGSLDFREYEKRYGKNYIMIMEGRKNELKPVLMNQDNSGRPSVSYKDDILFISRTDQMDGFKENPVAYHDLFLHRKDKITRLTKMQDDIRLAHIAPDGERIVFLIKNKNNEGESIWLIKSDGSVLSEIKIPKEKLDIPLREEGGRNETLY